MAENLEALVARTAGSQPWRKVFHAANALLIALGLTVLDSPSWLAPAVLGAICAALVAADVARLASPGANALFFQAFSRLASPREASAVASSTWYMVGALVAVAFLPRDAAISGILVLGLADPAAAIVGRAMGRRPFLGGTLEGSLACFATAVLVLALRHPWPVALVAAAAATVTERRSWPLDDNLTIPVVTAGTVTVLTSLAG